VRLQGCYTESGVYNDEEDRIFDNPLIQGL
jgi:hypothetical protein